MLRKNKLPPKQAGESSLDAVYHLADRVQSTEDEVGIVTLWQPQDHKIQQVLRRIKFRIPEHTKLTLDEYGSFVIRHLDGAATVEIIGLRLAERFGDQVEPLYERLIPYLRFLARDRRLIQEISPESNQSTDPASPGQFLG